MKTLTLFKAAAWLLPLLFVPSVQAAPFTAGFATLPAGGVITVQPGQLAGWGYKLDNTDTVHWFVPTALSASSFSLGVPDASYFDFPVLAPGATAQMAFNAGSHSGLYGIQLFPFALAGQSDSGSFTLQGEWWSGDPLAGGAFLQTADLLATPFVLQVAPAAVPLPGSLLLLAGGLPLLWWRQRGCQKGAQLGFRLR